MTVYFCFLKFKTTLMVAEDEDEEVSSFALMFGCNERGICMHGKPNVESDFFNQIFPKTKLVGGFDLGEFYREILVHYPKLVTLPPPAQIHRVHVSVFLVVSMEIKQNDFTVNLFHLKTS